jgi:WD40 repeat protein
MESFFTHTHPCSIEYPHKSAIQAIWCDKKEDDVVEVGQSMWDWTMEGGSSGRIEYPTGVTATDLDNATTIFTGDKLGVVACWKVVSIDGTTQLEYIYHMHMGDLLPRPQNLSVRSVCEQAGMLAVGTLGSEIFEVPVTSVAAAIVASRAASPVKEDSAKEGACELGRTGHNVITPALGDCRRLISGHSQGEVWGLSPHPIENVFLTAGDDRTIRCWNLVENKCLTWIKLKDKSRAVAWRPTRHAEEEEVAVATNGGMIYILDSRVFINPKSLVASVDPSAAADAPKAAVDTSLDALRVFVADGNGRTAAVKMGQAVDLSPAATDGKPIGIKHAFKGPKKWVQDLKYSFEGSYLAVGSHDCNIYLYDVASGYDPSLTRVLKAHSSYITHIDFGLQLAGPEESFDPKKGKLTIRDVSGKDAPREVDIKDCRDRVVIRSTCGAYELLFWYAASGARIKFASSLRDAFWATLTCPFGWGVQGIWPPGADGTDVNAVARSHSYQDVPVVATVDDFGLVKVFNYPCLTVGAPDKCYKGHSAHVTNLGFSADDSYLITTGGDDKCVFVWSTDILEELRERKASSANTHSRYTCTLAHVSNQ